MRVHFWGVRGSIPTPLTPIQYKNRIAAIIQRITPKDLESEDTREKFINDLPLWLKSTIGGNSSCVELVTDDNQFFIFDGGSGLRELNKEFAGIEAPIIHMFFSHFHWDHIQGIPFFETIYNKKATLHIYSPWPAQRKILARQMSFPYFPAKWEDTNSPKIFYHTIKNNKTIMIGDCEISCNKMYHPGNSYSYTVKENGKKFCYATDVELSAVTWQESKKNKEFFKNTDFMILDAQYTVEELNEKPNWGHSSFCHCVDMAVEWGIKKLYLFHHEPRYDDKKIYTILQTAQWYADSIKAKDLEIFVATEETDILI